LRASFTTYGSPRAGTRLSWCWFLNRSFFPAPFGPNTVSPTHSFIPQRACCHSYHRVPVCVLCIQSRFRCQQVASQVGFHFTPEPDIIICSNLGAKDTVYLDLSVRSLLTGLKGETTRPTRTRFVANARTRDRKWLPDQTEITIVNQ
jgi:hypothetical protein